MTQLYHVEDDDLKARTVARIVSLARPDFEIVRLHSFVEFCDRVCDDVNAPDSRKLCCITDWQFPRQRGGAVQVLGPRVLDIFGDVIPTIVISGADKPADFDRHYPGTPWLNLGQVLELQAWLVKL